MKKVVILALAVVFAQAGFSQLEDAGEVKSFRFGLKIAPSVNWLQPKDTKKFERAGTPLSFNWGLVTEFKLADLFSVSTGLELNHEAGKIKYLDEVNYFINDDFEFIETEENESTGLYTVSDTSKPFARVKPSERKYSNTYVTIPVALKMKTKEIGYLTYFGEFGLNFAIRTSTKVSDEATDDDIANFGGANIKAADLDNLILKKDINLARVQLSIGAGAEYSLAGSTSVFGAIHYNLGFTNSVRNNSIYMIGDDSQPTKQSFSAHGVRLSVGILF